MSSIPAPKLPDIDSLSLVEQVAQMIVVRSCGMLYDHQIQYPEWELSKTELHDLIHNYGVGGVILLGGSAAEIALKTNQMQSWAKVPLLIAADIEEGVGQRFAGATWFPPPMSLQDVSLEYAEAMGKITAEEAIAIGINWILAPVVDINNNPDNPVINVRAFGVTVGEVMGGTRSFIAGAKHYSVLTTAKHFPGHGDTGVDSHLQTPTLEHDRQRFDNVEFPPFINAIAAGVDAIMSAHILAPELDPHHIATLSPHILTDILRNELGFDGIITTDALIMAGVADLGSPEAIAVQAVKAGADILLMPVDPITTIHAICTAVEMGEISRDRILQSVQRIWKAKQKVCGIAPNLAKLGNPHNLKVADEIATNAISAFSQIKNLPNLEKPSPQSSYLNLIVVDDPLTAHEFLGLRSPSVTLPKSYQYQRLIADGNTLDHLNYQDFSHVLLQVFSRGNPFRGNTNLHTKVSDLILDLLSKKRLQAVIIYGSPYVLDNLLPLLPAELPWGFAYSQQPVAQDAVLRKLGFDN